VISEILMELNYCVQKIYFKIDNADAGAAGAEGHGPAEP
jgi:hypothetical protein